MSSILGEEASSPGAGALRQTAGSWLREARQQKGLHIGALAAMLKVPQAKLEALESDRWQDLPDTTFARALAKAMCRVLKVDAAPVLALLPSSADRELTVSRGLNQPFRDRVASDEALSLRWLQRPVVWAPLLLLAAAAAIYWMPASWLATRPVQAESESAAPVLAPAEDAGLAARTPAASEMNQPAAAPGASAVQPALATAAASSPPATVALTSVPGAIVPPAAAPRQAASSTPVAVLGGSTPSPTERSLAAALQGSAALTPPPPAPGSIPLQVKVSSESWVEVVDASGRTLLSNLLRPGDVRDLSGLPPLKVRVGNVAGTELRLRGAAVDLAARSKDNVARLELN